MERKRPSEEPRRRQMPRHDRDEPIKIDADPEEVLAALLRTPPAEED